MEIHLIWTQDRQGAIGQEGARPSDLPEDTLRFTELTEHSPIIMGKKTWDYLNKRALSSQQTVVITRQLAPEGNGRVTFVHTMDEALAVLQAVEPEHCFIIGGAYTFKTAMPYATRLLVTCVDTQLPHPDAFAPSISPLHWNQVSESPWLTGKNGVKFFYKEFARVTDV
ncbi:MAG: dihydrofolate reductase [Agitococcus sp.]|nr:dihydrofolate reductase [Agitococcus sp.]MDO9179207.1 dihydrofolate reductase [Agitococcus sp.]